MPGKIGYRRPAHVPEASAVYEARPERAEDRAFYKSAAWRRCRAAFLAEHPLCNGCKVVPAVHVHHLAERKQRPDLAYVWENLEALCIPCHNGRRANPG